MKIKFEITDTTSGTLRRDMKVFNRYIVEGKVIRENTEWRKVGRVLVKVSNIINAELSGNQHFATSPIGRQIWVSNNNIMS